MSVSDGKGGNCRDSGGRRGVVARTRNEPGWLFAKFAVGPLVTPTQFGVQQITRQSFERINVTAVVRGTSSASNCRLDYNVKTFCE